MFRKRTKTLSCLHPRREVCDMAKRTETIAEMLAHGSVVSWNMRNTPTRAHGKYTIRLELTFLDGTTQGREYGGYSDLKSAVKKRAELLTELTEHTYLPFRVKTGLFLDYWLKEHMAKRKVRPISYQTFSSYQSAIRCHIIPKIGHLYLDAVTTETIVTLINPKSPSIAKTVQSILETSFRFAVKMHLLNRNVAKLATDCIRKQEKHRKKQEADKLAREEPDTDRIDWTKRHYALTAEQTGQMLAVAKAKYPSLFIALLLACVTGCRISELLAIRYRDVDYQKKVIYLKAQLGRPVDASALKKGEIASCRIPTKSINGVRTIPVPDFVLDEILASRIRWEQTETSMHLNTDDVAVWHQENGRPYTRYGYAKPFKKLKQELDMPEDFHWHDLRHTYATLMAKHDVNIRELATVLGHAKAEFTMQMYVVSEQPVYELLSPYEQMLESVFPYTVQCPMPGKQREILDPGAYINVLDRCIRECHSQRVPCTKRGNTV